MTSFPVKNEQHEPADALLYISLMSAYLKNIADRSNQAFLAYLLSMVVEEAVDVRGRLDPREESDAA